MPFQRSDWRGLSLDWFAADRDGSVAIFTTGFGPVPRAVFADEQVWGQTREYFEELPESCPATLTPRIQRDMERGVGEYSLFLADARKGLFCYEEENYGPVHRLYALPGDPLQIGALSAPLAAFVSEFRVEGHRFADLEFFNPTRFFECVS
jgi:hypothetical protein